MILPSKVFLSISTGGIIFISMFFLLSIVIHKVL